jgi:hypothetical protein
VKTLEKCTTELKEKTLEFLNKGDCDKSLECENFGDDENILEAVDANPWKLVSYIEAKKDGSCGDF